MCAAVWWRHVRRRCGGAAAWRRRVPGVWREVRQWERGRERVSVCLFVTLCHLSKYSCIVVRCESPRVWVSSSLLLLRFSKTVTGPLGRHSNYWAERICFPVPKEKLLFLLTNEKRIASWFFCFCLLLFFRSWNVGEKLCSRSRSPCGGRSSIGHSVG